MTWIGWHFISLRTDLCGSSVLHTGDDECKKQKVDQRRVARQV